MVPYPRRSNLVEHESRMLSLDKVSSEEELQNWFASCQRRLGDGGETDSRLNLTRSQVSN